MPHAAASALGARPADGPAGSCSRSTRATRPAGAALDVRALDVRVLGELVVSRQGERLDLGGPRQRAVLALLVLARGEVASADALIDALWGTRPVANATGALQSAISHLRRRLEPSQGARARGNIIVRRGPGYALAADPRAVDAWRFERMVTTSAALADPAAVVTVLREALRLWRGPAFAEYAAEPWAQADAARLTELRAVARERLLAARLELGEAATVVPEIEALVAEAPLREERWRLLAVALYRAHRQGDALAALRRARQTLADELGVDPGPALRELEAQIRAQSLAVPVVDVTGLIPAARGPAVHDLAAHDLAAHDPAGAVVPARPALPARPAPRAASATAFRRGEDLVDRDRELGMLRAGLTLAFEGRAQLVLIEGPAGIGKTRLLTECRRMAADLGAMTCTARSSPLERGFPFGVARQLFEPLVTDPDQAAVALAGRAAPAAAVFDVANPDAATGGGGLAALHGLYLLTANLAADRPLVLCVDDLQWCDGESLRYLAYLQRRLEGMPLLVLATVRSGEPDPDGPPISLIAELALDPATVHLRPHPLTTRGVTDLVRGRLGPDAAAAFADACHRATAGNPLLLHQLLEALQSAGVRPDAAPADTVTAIGARAVSSTVLLRLARMPAAASAIARAVAVLGDGASLPAVAALAGLPEAEAARAVAVLVRAEVLRDEHPLGFVHPLVGDAVYRDLPVVERQLHHERAARVLRRTGARAEQIAGHLRARTEA